MLTDAMATLLPSHATCLLFVGAARHPSFVVERCKVPFRELGASEVLLRVRLAGLCASDIRRFVSEDGECALPASVVTLHTTGLPYSIGAASENVSTLHLDIEDDMVNLGHGVKCTVTAWSTMSTTSNVKDWCGALLAGVFGKEARLYRANIREKLANSANLRIFPEKFKAVALALYQDFLRRTRPEVVVTQRILKPILSMLSQKARDMNGRRNKHIPPKHIDAVVDQLPNQEVVMEEIPEIPGHEAVGDVIASRRPGVDVGSRVVFSSSNWCLKCKWCRRGDHVACEDITKYGQPPLAAPSSSEGLGGALSSLVLLRVGTAVCAVPTAVPDRHAILASCALATALAGLLRLTASSRRRDDQDAPSVLVQGCGLVGILSCAVLVQSGYRVFCEDGDLSRLRIAAKFHAQPIFKETGPLTPSSTLPERLDAVVLAFGGSLESNGGPRAKPTSLLQGQAGLLRPGGTLLLLGQPSDTKNTYSAILEAGTILEKGFCVIGASEYQPENLKDAVQFLEATEGKFPYDELLSPVYGMLDFQSALTSALDGRFLRVLVRPSC